MKTVNFIEAVNSGRNMKTDMIDLVNYRLESSFRTSWQMLKEISECKHTDAVGRIINAKYELEEKSITITESEFDELVSHTVINPDGSVWKSIKKKIGF